MLVLVLALLMLSTRASALAASALYGSAGCDYSIQLYIGGQGPFLTIIDTGSSNTAVASSQCSSCGVSPEYTGPLSGGSSVSISFGDGSTIKGTTTSDLMSIGTSSTTPVSVGFMGITTQTGFFQCEGVPGSQYQGIVGLGYPYLAQGGVTTFMEYATSAGVPDGFAIQLCPALANQAVTASSGNFWLGGVDTSHTSGSFQYVSIVKQQYYNVQVNSFSLGGKTLNLPSSVGSGIPWIIDSGTTNIVFLNDADYTAVVTAIINSGIVQFSASVSESEINSFWQGGSSGTYYAIAASSMTVNPNILLTVTLEAPGGGSTTLTIQTSNFIQNLTNSGETVYRFSGFSSDSGLNANILGETLLQNMTTFFDRGSNNRIGFAPTAKCGTPATTAGINLLASNPSSVIVPSILSFGIAILSAMFLIRC